MRGGAEGVQRLVQRWKRWHEVGRGGSWNGEWECEWTWEWNGEGVRTGGAGTWEGWAEVNEEWHPDGAHERIEHLHSRAWLANLISGAALEDRTTRGGMARESAKRSLRQRSVQDPADGWQRADPPQVKSSAYRCQRGGWRWVARGWPQVRVAAEGRREGRPSGSRRCRSGGAQPWAG